MSQAVSEIATLPLRADVNLDSGEDKQILDDTLATIAKQPGFKSMYWGLKVEDPGVMQMVINWSDTSNHATFMSSPGYPAFLERVGKLLSGAPSIFHALLPQNQDKAPFEAQVTECISLYVPADIDEASYLTHKWDKFVKEAANGPNAGYKGMVSGFSIEPQMYEGVEGKMFAAFIGWENMEKYLEYRKREESKMMVGMLREGSVGVETWHVGFEKYP